LRRIPVAAPTAVLTAVLAAAFAAPEATALPPFPSPIHVLNVAAPCSQRNPDLAALGGGGFVATWTGTLENGFGVGGRLLDAEGTPVGGELVFSDEAQFGVDQARVAPISDGGFAVARMDFEPGTAPGFPNEFSILMRAFDADGGPRSPEVLVTALTTLQQVGFALATDGHGRPAVAWNDVGTVRFRLFDADLTARTGIRTAVAFDPSPGSGDLVGHASIAAGEDGELLVVWEEGPVIIADPLPPWTFERVRGRRFDPDGTARGPAFTIDEAIPGSRFTQSPAAAALAGGGWAVAWAWNPPPGSGPVGVYTRVLDAAGSPLGAAFLTADLALEAAFDPDLAAVPDGGFALAFSGDPLPPPIIPPPFFYGPVVLFQRFDAEGAPLGAEEPVDVPSDRDQSNPAVAFGGDGRLEVVWRRAYPSPIILPPPCSEQATIEARGFDLGCIEEGERLCLQGGRIAVEVLVDDPRVGEPRMARAEKLTDDSGTFWLFREENVEMAVKVLDGAGVNGFFWFFSGSLSDLGYEIVVTDTLTGEDRRYENLPGEVASRADTRALPSPPALPGSQTGPGRAAGTMPDTLPGAPGGAAGPVVTADEAGGAGGSPPRSLAGEGFPLPGCDDPGVLCLHDGRFAVSIEWHEPRTGASGVATGVPLSDRAAYFWFFRPANAEVVLKILDGSEVNGFFWVFFGALTDLEYRIEVVDLLNGCHWRYDNPPFTLTSHADTMAQNGQPLPCRRPGAGAATRSAHGGGRP
jgi:hypothetical protein